MSQNGQRTQTSVGRISRSGRAHCVAASLAAVFVLAGSGIAFAANSVPTPIDATYKLVFDDEFSGTALRRDRWTANWLGCPTCVTPPVQPQNELAAYDPNQVTVGGGVLALTANAAPATVNGKTYKYRSGMIQSNDHARFTYGYFEARIKLPGRGGKITNWPAFWLNGQKWPVDGEVDIAEALGGRACYHFHSPAGGPGACARGNYTGWHVFGALWEPRAITYYYDGKKVGSIKKGLTHSPMYMILNHAVSTIGGAISAPSIMYVDYVHVYSADPRAAAVTPDPGYGGPGDAGTVKTTLN